MSSNVYLGTPPSSTSDNQLSALGEIKNLPVVSDSGASRDMVDDAEDAFDADSRDEPYPFLDLPEIAILVDEATSYTAQLIPFWIQTSAMMQTPEAANNANLCRDVHNCLKAIPEALVPSTAYVPSEESKWKVRRRGLEESLLKNLRKYSRYSDHLLRRPPRADEFHAALNKLHAFADKFFHLSRKLRASNEKLVLMELCDAYMQMKLARLEERKLRASVRADRAARKTEREMLRRQRARPL